MIVSENRQRPDHQDHARRKDLKERAEALPDFHPDIQQLIDQVGDAFSGMTGISVPAEVHARMGRLILAEVKQLRSQHEGEVTSDSTRRLYAELLTAEYLLERMRRAQLAKEPKGKGVAPTTVELLRGLIRRAALQHIIGPIIPIAAEHLIAEEVSPPKTIVIQKQPSPEAVRVQEQAEEQRQRKLLEYAHTYLRTGQMPLIIGRRETRTAVEQKIQELAHSITVEQDLRMRNAAEYLQAQHIESPDAADILSSNDMAVPAGTTPAAMMLVLYDRAHASDPRVGQIPIRDRLTAVELRQKQHSGERRTADERPSAQALKRARTWIKEQGLSPETAERILLDDSRPIPMADGSSRVAMIRALREVAQPAHEEEIPTEEIPGRHAAQVEHVISEAAASVEPPTVRLHIKPVHRISEAEIAASNSPTAHAEIIQAAAEAVDRPTVTDDRPARLRLELRRLALHQLNRSQCNQHLADLQRQMDNYGRLRRWWNKNAFNDLVAKHEQYTRERDEFSRKIAATQQHIAALEAPAATAKAA